MAQPTNQAERSYLARLIGGARLFHMVAPDDVAELARTARSLAVPRGKPLAPPKGKDDEIYVIEAGAAALLDRDPAADKAILVALLGPGETVGLVRAAEYLAGAPSGERTEWRALSNLTAVAIPMQDFVRVMRRSTELYEAAFAALGQLLRKLAIRYSAALQSPLEMRLAALFADLGAIAAGNQWEPSANIGKLQQTQIAEMLGVSREHVNRTLIMWERSGLIFQTKGGDIVIENRKRLSQLAGARRAHAGSLIENEWLWEIEAHINHGLNGAAYDLAMEGVKRSPKDDRYKYLAVLAMARMNALGEALSLADNFKLSTEAANEDIASVGPRLRRDLAFDAAEGPDRAQLKTAAEGYEKVFRALNTTYPGVNAASTYAMAGDLDRAQRLAAEVSGKAAAALDDIDEDEPSYWPRATLAECRLIAGDRAGAAADYMAAARAIDAAPGKIATTRKQLHRLKGALPIDGDWINAALPLGPVLYYSGPLTPPGADSHAALDRLRARFSDFLSQRKIVAAVGALAAGADIVLAETLIEAGVALHVHLPLPPTEFLASSAAPAGDAWAARYIACVERAQTIEWTRRQPASHAAYRLGSRIAIGRTVRQAEDLSTEAFGFFALQRGRTAEDSISRENAELWRALGLKAEVVEDDWPATAPKAARGRVVDYYAALVVQGAKDARMQAIDRLAPEFRTRAGETAVFAFKTTTEAIEAARALSSAPDAAGLRLWLDIGVAPDGAARAEEFANSLIAASCRPETPPGKTFASESFVCAAAATPGPRPRFEYVGIAPTEEKLDPCPLFLTDL